MPRSALWEMGEGVVNLGVGIAQTSYDIGPLGQAITGVTDAYEAVTGNQVDLPGWLPSAERGAARLQAAADVVSTIVQDPGLVVDAVIDPIRQDWNNGNYGEAIGRGIVEVAGIFVGTKGVDKVAKTARVADAVGDTARVARAADRADTLSETGRSGRAAIDGADDATDAARAGRPVDEAGDVAETGPKQPMTLAQRRQLAFDFYVRQGFDPKRIDSHLSGIDFSQPVEVVRLPKGTEVVQWQVPGGRQGNYYAPPGTSADRLGISPRAMDRATGETVDKAAATYVTTRDVEVLRSTAAAVEDTWSVPGRSIPVEGGGIQMMSTESGAFRAVGG